MSEKIVENPEEILLDEKEFKIIDTDEKNEEALVEVTAEKEEKELTEDIDEKKEDKPSETKEDALIITHEEDLDIPSSKIPEPEEKIQPIVKSKPNYVWVSNIGRQTKATSLKKLFNQHGKVLTAKIVTNKKNFFGYVAMETHEVALKCIKELNDGDFEGKKISVSMERPDTSSSKVVKKVKKVDDENVKNVKKEVTKKKLDVDWRYEYQRTKTEVDRLRRRLVDNDRRYVGAQGKIHRLELSLKDLHNQLRDERRKFNKEKDEMERKTALELKKCVEDRVMINKELDDVRKLRETLKQKMKEVEMRSRHCRSRSASPKRKKWSERTPPPPPKLTDNRKRQYYEEKAKNTKRSPPNYNPSSNRHRDSKNLPLRTSSAPWSSNNFVESPWRQPNGSQSQMFPNDSRYQSYPMSQPFSGGMSEPFYRGGFEPRKY